MPYVGTSPSGDLLSSHSGTAQVVRELLFICHFPLLPSGPQTKCVSPPPSDSSLEKDRHKDPFSRDCHFSGGPSPGLADCLCSFLILVAVGGRGVSAQSCHT